MRFSLPILAFAISTSLANPVDLIARGRCVSDKCLRGLVSSPKSAYPYCYSYLGRIATKTKCVTKYQTFTAVQTSTVSTETLYPSTVTVTAVAAPPRLVKRNQPFANSCKKSCENKPSKISSACSCFLGRATSTTIITVTKTIPVTKTQTVPITLTTLNSDPFTTTSTCYPTATAVITNGDFESGSLDPWYLAPLGSDSILGTYDISGDATSPDPLKSFHASLIAPTGGRPFRKVNIAQKLVACPGVTYRISFYFKLLNSNNANIFLVGTVDGQGKFYYTSGSTWTAATNTFTATDTSATFQLDLVRGLGTGNVDMYIDGVVVTIE